MKKSDIQLFKNIVISRIDEEIKKSKMIYEAEEDTDPLDTAYKGFFGRQLKGKSAPMSTVPMYPEPAIENPLIREDKGLNKACDHAILKMILNDNYFNHKKNTTTGQRELFPQPLLIWGAPGIGKSDATKQAAVRAAKRIAEKKGLSFKIIKADTQEWPPMEEIKKNFYFLEWNEVNKDNIQDHILIGPKIAADVDAGGRMVKKMVSQYDLRIPAENLFIYFDVRVAGIAEQDILGMPVRVDKPIKTSGETVETPSIDLEKLPFLKLCCSEPKLHGFIMWDEINQGTHPVQAALYQIILDRQVGGAKLAPGIGNFAAANSKMWGGEEPKPALISRFATRYLYLSPEEFIKTFKDELVPGLRRFVEINPKVAFYINEQIWNDKYMPMVRGAGVSGLEGGVEGMKEYVKNPSYGKWPTPRDLSKFNMQFKSLMDEADEGGWDQNEVIERATELASGILGPVFADEFRKFSLIELNLNWDQLAKDSEYAKESAKNINLKFLLSTLISDKLTETYNLSILPINAAAFKKEAATLFGVICNIGESNLEFVMEPISRVKEELQGAVKDEIEKNKVSSRIMGVIEAGMKQAPASMHATGQSIFMKIKKSLLRELPQGTLTGATFAGNTFNPSTVNQTPSASPVDNTEPPVRVGGEFENAIPEKYTIFNQLYEDVKNSLTPDPVPVPVENSASDMKRQIGGVTGILERAFASLNTIPSTGMDKNIDTKRADIVKQAVLQDTMLSKEQKQKLISIIKDAPDAINMVLMLRAYASPWRVLRL